MFRKSLDADAPYADAAVHGDGPISLQFRRRKGGHINREIPSFAYGRPWIKPRTIAPYAHGDVCG